MVQFLSPPPQPEIVHYFFPTIVTNLPLGITFTTEEDQPIEKKTQEKDIWRKDVTLWELEERCMNSPSRR